MPTPIADIVGGIAGRLIAPVTDIIKEVVTDKDEANRLAAQITTLVAQHAHDEVMGQIEVNNTQAKHPSLFVSGARPFMMWVCAFALGYNTIIHPIMGIWLTMPPIDSGLLYPVLLGLLGLTGSRTVEKINGVARENMGYTINR